MKMEGAKRRKVDATMYAIDLLTLLTTVSWNQPTYLQHLPPDSTRKGFRGTCKLIVNKQVKEDKCTHPQLVQRALRGCLAE